MQVFKKAAGFIFQAHLEACTDLNYLISEEVLVQHLKASL